MLAEMACRNPPVKGSSAILSLCTVPAFFSKPLSTQVFQVSLWPFIGLGMTAISETQLDWLQQLACVLFIPREIPEKLFDAHISSYIHACMHARRSHAPLYHAHTSFVQPTLQKKDPEEKTLRKPPYYFCKEITLTETSLQ